MRSCRVIVAAFLAGGICSGPNEGSVLCDRVHQLVVDCGLHVVNSEQVEDGDCFALVLHCETNLCGSNDLQALREDLRREGLALGLRFRVQREDLFLAMHRV